MLATTSLDGIGSVAHVRHVIEDERSSLVLDFGPGTDDVSYDVLEDMILIVDADGNQYELSLSVNDSRTFMKNGILTIEVDQ